MSAYLYLHSSSKERPHLHAIAIESNQRPSAQLLEGEAAPACNRNRELRRSSTAIEGTRRPSEGTRRRSKAIVCSRMQSYAITLNWQCRRSHLLTRTPPCVTFGSPISKHEGGLVLMYTCESGRWGIRRPSSSVVIRRHPSASVGIRRHTSSVVMRRFVSQSTIGHEPCGRRHGEFLRHAHLIDEEQLGVGLRSDQRQSTALSGNQRHSAALSGTQRPSAATLTSLTKSSSGWASAWLKMVRRLGLVFMLPVKTARSMRSRKASFLPSASS